MRKDILERKEEVLQWISENQSKACICRNLKCKPLTLETWLKKWDISYAGNQGGKGKKSDPKRKSALEYSKSSCIKSSILKRKLIEDGVKDRKCEGCDNTNWMGCEIPLELHHKDGNRFNNDLLNLEILCPNCHALTPNNSGKGVGLYTDVAQLAEAVGLGPAS